MKKWVLAAMALMVSAPAFARTNNGPYIAVRFAGTGLEAEMDGVEHSKEKNTVFTYGAAFGIRLKDVRAELDWASASRADYGEYSYLQQRVMLQLYYDIPLRSVIRPFINVGAGMAYTDFEKRHHSSSDDMPERGSHWRLTVLLMWMWGIVMWMRVKKNSMIGRS